MKKALLEYFSYLNTYDFILYAVFLMLAMCLIFLSFLTFRKKFISIPSFLIGFGIVIAIPFALRYFMENRFYKIETNVIQDGVLRYSPVYQYNATITNVGKYKIAGCLLSHQILYDTNNQNFINKYKYLLLNYAKPKKVYSKDIPMDLAIGESVKVSMQSQEFNDGYPNKGEKYRTKIECYGKKRYSDNAHVLKGKFIPKVDNKQPSQNNAIEINNNEDVYEYDEGDTDDDLETNQANRDNIAPTTTNNTEAATTNIPDTSNKKEDKNIPEEITTNIPPNDTESNNTDSNIEEKNKEWEVPRLLKEAPR